jgi:hypothetical protein
LSVPHHYELPEAARADATDSIETPTYVITPPKGSSWAISGSSSLPNGSLVQCDAPQHLLSSLQLVGVLVDQLRFCVVSGTAWEKVQMENDRPNPDTYPLRWGVSVALLELAGDAFVFADSIRMTSIVDSIQAAERESPPSDRWKGIDASTVASPGGPYRLIHFTGQNSDASGWVALKAHGHMVLAVLSRNRPGSGSEEYRVLESLRGLATHYGVFWGVVGDKEGHPIESALVTPWVNLGSVLQVSPCTNLCGYSGPDGAYRLNLRFAAGLPIPADLRFWLVASAPGRPDLKEATDTLPLPGPITAPLDSVRVDFVLTP